MMARSAVGTVLVGLLFLLGITACSTESEETVTPEQAATIAGRPFEPIAISPITLVRNPSALKDQYIELEGSYKHHPIQVCPEESHESPIGWNLVIEGLEIPASGYDQQLRGLAQDGMSMVVEGRWKEWEGPVGCGRRAPVQQIWYLEVSEIISPNPLTAVRGEAGAIADVPGSEDDLTPELPAVTVIGQPPTTAEVVIPTATVSEASDEASTSTAAETPTPLPVQTATGTAPAEDIQEGTAETALTPGATPTADGTTTAASEAGETATATSEVSGTATETRTPTVTAEVTETATVTEEPSSTATAVVSSEDFMSYDDIVTSSVGAGAVIRFDFDGSVDEVVTISAAPEPDLDIILELVSPGGTILASSDGSGTGQQETISQESLGAEGTYGVRVKSKSSGEGRFALALSESESEAFLIFRGFLAYGSSGSDDLPEGTDHLYAFSGASGERATIEVEAATANDMVIYIYDPAGNELEFIDDDNVAAVGSREVLQSYELPATGIFIFRVGEWDFNQAGYQYSLQQG